MRRQLGKVARLPRTLPQGFAPEPGDRATILPAMKVAEAIESPCIRLVAGLSGALTAIVTARLFRAPCHTVSDVGRSGGHRPLPGAESLVHNDGCALFG